MAFRVDVNKKHGATTTGPGLIEQFVAGRPSAITDMSVAGAPGASASGLGELTIKFAKQRRDKAKDDYETNAVLDMRIAIAEEKQRLSRDHQDQAGNWRGMAGETLTETAKRISAAGPEGENPALFRDLNARARIGALDIGAAGLSVERQVDAQKLDLYLEKAAGVVSLEPVGSRSRQEALEEAFAKIDRSTTLTSIARKTAKDTLQSRVQTADVLHQISQPGGAEKIAAHPLKMKQWSDINSEKERSALYNKAQGKVEKNKTDRLAGGNGIMASMQEKVLAAQNIIEQFKEGDPKPLNELIDQAQAAKRNVTKPENWSADNVVFRRMRSNVARSRAFAVIKLGLDGAVTPPEIALWANKSKQLAREDFLYRSGVRGLERQFHELIQGKAVEMIDLTSSLKGDLDEARTLMELNEAVSTMDEIREALKHQGVQAPEAEWAAMLDARKREIVGRAREDFMETIAEQDPDKQLNALGMEKEFRELTEFLTHFGSIDPGMQERMQARYDTHLVFARVKDEMANETFGSVGTSPAVFEKYLNHAQNEVDWIDPASGKASRMKLPEYLVKTWDEGGRGKFFGISDDMGGYIPEAVSNAVINGMNSGDNESITKAGEIALDIRIGGRLRSKSLEQHPEIMKMASITLAARALGGNEEARQNYIAYQLGYGEKPGNLDNRSANQITLEDARDYAQRMETTLFERAVRNNLHGYLSDRVFGKILAPNLQMVGELLTYVNNSQGKDVASRFAEAHAAISANYGPNTISGSTANVFKPPGKVLYEKNGGGDAWVRNAFIRKVGDEIRSSFKKPAGNKVSKALEFAWDGLLGEGAGMFVADFFDEVENDEAIFDRLNKSGRLKIVYAQGEITQHPRNERVDGKAGPLRTANDNWNIHIQSEDSNWTNIGGGPWAPDFESSPEKEEHLKLAEDTAQYGKRQAKLLSAARDVERRLSEANKLRDLRKDR